MRAQAIVSVCYDIITLIRNKLAGDKKGKLHHDIIKTLI